MKKKLMKAYVGFWKKVYKCDELYKEDGVWHIVYHQ